MNPTETKQRLRALLRERLRGMDDSRRERESRSIVETVRRLPEWQAARSMLLFWPRPDEPDIRPLLLEALASDREVALPSYHAGTGIYGARKVQSIESDLCVGRFGILEPRDGCLEIPLAGLDFALIPGLAFDHSGGRLGRGGGFYDRLLAGVRGTTCGVGFGCQWMESVPMEAHDVKLKRIVIPPAHEGGMAR